MGEKKYYWLKRQNDFFSHKEIKKLRKIAGGDTYTVIYLKMLLVSLKNDGCLFYDGVEETFAEELALELDEEKDNVDVTLKFLMVHGLIEETSQNQFSLPGTVNAIGAETSGNIRVKRHREKLKALQCNDSVTPMKRIVNGEKEKDLEKEKKTKNKDNNFQNLINKYTTNEKLLYSLDAFIEMRKEIKHPLTARALQMILNKLNELSADNDEMKIKLLDKSTINGWRDIFISKEVQNQKPKEPQTEQQILKGIVKNGG